MLSIRHAKRKRLSLDDILNGPDEFGLLNVEAKRFSSSSPPEVSKFEEINTFIDQEGRQPEFTGELPEKLLARRMQSYIDNAQAHEAIRAYDRHNLLASTVTQASPLQNTDIELTGAEKNTIGEIKESRSAGIEDVAVEEAASLEDIFNSDMFSQMDFGDQSLFEMTHVPSIDSKEKPEEVARRKVCKDFYKFEPIFKNIHSNLQSGKMQSVRYKNEVHMHEGDVFIAEGVVCLIAEIGDYRENSEGRYDPRMRVIFENGTESNLLLRSLGKRLWLDETGRKIVRQTNTLIDDSNTVSDQDKRAGQIYIVTTKSENPILKSIPNLVKIGYTEHTVEQRTKNATRDTAFLEAPVRILAAMDCYNLNPNKFETLIHGFFHAQRLNVTLTGRDGRAYHPQEWFSVPLDTVREVVKRIIDGSIVNYRMDNTTTTLVRKKNRM